MNENKNELKQILCIISSIIIYLTLITLIPCYITSSFIELKQDCDKAHKEMLNDIKKQFSEETIQFKNEFIKTMFIGKEVLQKKD